MRGAQWPKCGAGDVWKSLDHLNNIVNPETNRNVAFLIEYTYTARSIEIVPRGITFWLMKSRGGPPFD